MLSCCVLIPSYNEAKAIGPLVAELRKNSFTVYVVDDGSADATAQIAQRQGAIVIRHPKNTGKGISLREGFQRVLRDGFSSVLIMDADGQHKASDIKAMIQKMDNTGADLVVGNRMTNTKGMPLVRLITNQFMSWLISNILRQPIPDTQCGFRLIKREVLEKIRLECLHYEIESELILRAGRQGFKIESVPIQTVYEGAASRINPILDTFRFIWLLIRVAISP